MMQLGGEGRPQGFSTWVDAFLSQDNYGANSRHQDQSKDNGMVAVMRNRNDIEPHVIEKILTSNPAKYYGI